MSLLSRPIGEIGLEKEGKRKDSRAKNFMVFRARLHLLGTAGFARPPAELFTMSDETLFKSCTPTRARETS